MNTQTTHPPSDIAAAGERALLVMRVLANPNITLSTQHVSGKQDFANARANALKTLFLMEANRSCYQNAPCGEVALSIPMLSAMLQLATTYRYRISEIAGGSHSRHSRHYAGVAMDVDMINGQAVSARNRDVPGFMSRCRHLGATEVLGPGQPGHDSHVHAGWPRPR